MFNEQWQKTKELLVDPTVKPKKSILDQLLQNTRDFLVEQKNEMDKHETIPNDIWLGEDDPWINILISIKKKYGLPPYNEPLNKVILPVLRRVMPQIIANEILGVQPMNGPPAQIFALRQRYGYLTHHRILELIKKKYNV